MKKNQKTSANLYGFHACHEAWLNSERNINALYITEQAEKGFHDCLKQAQKYNIDRPDPTIIDKSKLDKMLPKGAVHQGIAIDSAPIEEFDVQDFIIKAHSQARSVLAILDQVTDPHNVGAILRSASAFGLDGVIMQKKHAPSLDGVLAKTACGAVEHVPVAQATNISRAIGELQEAGFVVVGLDERGDDNLCTLDHERIVIVLGAEGPGIRHLVKESCDLLTRLPTQGAIGSLNVSNAAAVSFYAVMRA